MALNGYVLHVDLADVRELVSLQRRCANNLNQVAIHANTYGIYPSEIAALQKDYADLWGPLSVLIKSCRRWWSYNKTRGAQVYTLLPALFCFIGQICDYVVKLTIKYSAKGIQRVGRNGFIRFQPTHRGATDLPFDLQSVCGCIFALHSFPQWGV